MTREVAIGTSRGIKVQNDTATETYVVAPDIAAVRQAFWDWPHWCGRGTPERAWERAVSGDTAARMRTSEKVTDWECTARIIARAAAYGWWPQETTSGDYTAVPIDRWVASGHPYTKIVPNLDALLDRWNVAPVVIDADPGLSAIDCGSERIP
ncbi:hypothetical protein QDT91_29195 (plasmid) [Mycolicibacterium aubagnense]|uniref:hypothetical protein n=1 Tax=Mycolicibacterium aubagnense TaxID=319707 RepID=UPI0013F67BA8|nr:hypothetical protein [Mycolicibacterium aubagnense]WGI36096.1 hypothetical protein QDT91_29195 [Mycolicibacterium aubagnense]